MSKKSKKESKEIPLKKEKPVMERQSFESVDGFNLAEFSLSPLTYQTKDLAHKEISFEWFQTIGGKRKKCFFKLSYGATPPNADTEDYLLLLLFLAQKKGNPLSVETTFYEIMKTKGIDYKPGKQHKESILRHIKALYDLSIETNFIYNRETGKWLDKGVTTRVITDYAYKEKGYSRVRKVYDDENALSKEIIENISELDSINFAPSFFKYFVKDTIAFDLATYFSLANPTPKRLYRFGNKYVENLGSFGLDLVHFCITRLGMRESYVRSFPYISKLSAKLKPHIKRVNETVEGLEITIKKDDKKPSGYRINFDKSNQLQMPLSIEGFTKSEKKSYQLLVKHGVYSSPARKLVTTLRTHLGNKSSDYIAFVIRQFKSYQKRTDMKVGEAKQGGVLLNAFNNNWYFPHFMEWHSKKQKKEEQEEIKRYGSKAINLFEQASVAPTPPTEPKPSSKPVTFTPTFSRYSLGSFKEKHPDIYDEILKAQTAAIQQAKDEHGTDFVTGFGKFTIEQTVMKRVDFYCERCFTEWQKGNTEFRPVMSM